MSKKNIRDKKAPTILPGLVVALSMVIFVYASYFYSKITEVPQVTSSDKKSVVAEVMNISDKNSVFFRKEIFPVPMYQRLYNSIVIEDEFDKRVRLSERLKRYNDALISDYKILSTTFILMIIGACLCIAGAIFIAKNRLWIGIIIIGIGALFSSKMLLKPIIGDVGYYYDSYAFYWFIPNLLIAFFMCIFQTVGRKDNSSAKKQGDNVYYLNLDACIGNIGLAILLFVTFIGIPIGIWMLLRFKKIRFEFFDDEVLYAGWFWNYRWKYSEIKELGVEHFRFSGHGLAAYLVAKRLGSFATKLHIKNTQNKVVAVFPSSHEYSEAIIGTFEEKTGQNKEIVTKETLKEWKNKATMNC